MRLLKLKKYGDFNTRDALKVIALALMIVDHIGVYYLPEVETLRAFGRGAAPLFLFLAGYAGSYRVHPQLLLGALILCLVPLLFGFEFFPVNILITIILARWMLACVEKGWLKLRRPYEWMAVLTMFFLTMYLFQYGTPALLWAVAGYMEMRRQHYDAALRARFLALTAIIHLLLQYFSFGGLSLIDSIIATAAIGAVTYPLYDFKTRALPTLASFAPLHLFLLFCSRYTLWIYVIHYALMQIDAGRTY